MAGLPLEERERAMSKLLNLVKAKGLRAIA